MIRGQKCGEVLDSETGGFPNGFGVLPWVLLRSGKAQVKDTFEKETATDWKVRKR